MTSSTGLNSWLSSTGFNSWHFTNMFLGVMHDLWKAGPVLTTYLVFVTHTHTQTIVWHGIHGPNENEDYSRSSRFNISYSVTHTHIHTKHVRDVANISAEDCTILLLAVPSSSRVYAVKSLCDLAQVHWFSWKGSIIHEMCNGGTTSVLGVWPELSAALSALTFINIVWAICVPMCTGLPITLPSQPLL